MRLRMLAVALAFSSAFGSSNRAAVASPGEAAGQPRTYTTAVSASRRHHAGGRPYSSHYLGRPIYYSPGPMFPWLPFIPDWRDPRDW